MYIVQIASELAPIAKVGGLADVVYGLSRELELRGNAVEIILPKYDRLWYDQIFGLAPTYNDLWVPWCDGAIRCTVWFGLVHGRKCYFIEPHSPEAFFERGTFYGQWDDPARFIFFSKAALEYLYRSGKRPDIIHVHDWQTAALPVLLYEMYQQAGMPNQRVCHTIHNFRHQGITDGYMLYATGLGHPERYFTHERLRDNFNHFALNLMKGGIVYSNFVTTVSPTHAWEARFTDQSFGFGETLHIHQSKFGGVLNGLDYEAWNPALDPMIAAPFDAVDIDRREANTKALRERCNLTDSDKPILAYVGRLDSQKGVHLIRHALFYAMNHDAQFVLLGSSPEPETNDHFRHIAGWLSPNRDIYIEVGFNEQLAHLIYAGAHGLVVPSIYEPCGLTQMMAMRYGAVPIVRRVGGLADTVFDWDYDSRPRDQRCGFVFDHPDFDGIESALQRFFGLYTNSPKLFRTLQRQAMGRDMSWRLPGQHYLDIYEHIRHR
ncbi:MAG: glycogen synthase [Rhodospirillaceae bacterium]|nr:glycogen synthase [Rhodospirillaceae bacterium]